MQYKNIAQCSAKLADIIGSRWPVYYNIMQLASCLINIQPLPAHSPAADGNSLIGCTSHDLTDDWSLASTHVV